jgi:hypothetical protein
MDTWNREELYREIWNEPMSKLSKKYGVSGVMLGKVCRKLNVPVPGRGYWARKAFGHPVEVTPLPRIKNVPVVQRFKLPGANLPAETRSPEPEPSDAEYLRIVEVESLQVSVDPNAPHHRFVAATAKAFRSAYIDSQGYRNTRGQRGVLDLNLTDRTIDRAILILNSVLFALEKEGYPVKFKQDSSHAFATVFDQEVGFEIVEKYSQIRIPEHQRKDDFAPKARIEANGNLEFRVIHSRYGRVDVRDHKRNSLERQIPIILGAFLRRARSAKLRKERERQEAIERREREIERFKLSEQIRDEEKKLANLDAWVTNWSRARLYREFISTLEECWKAKGEDLSDGSERANRLVWMRQQADRLDPLAENPASILDRKRELNWY